MPVPVTPAALGSQQATAELVEQLVGLIDRTFAEAGHGEGMRAVREMLLRLDRPALRELVHAMGLEGPEELAEPEREDREPATE